MFYISQLNESDCGFASLKILLANIYNDESYLFLKQDEDHGPYSYFELIRIAQNLGTTIEGFKLANKQNIQDWQDFPIIVTFKKEDYSHSVVVLKKRRNKFLILDPDSSKRWMSLKEFIKLWDGTLLKVTKKRETPLADVKIEKEGKIKYSFLSQIIQISLSICFLLFLFFLDERFPIYVPLILALLYVIGEMFFRHILIRMMSDIDSFYINRLTKAPKEPRLYLLRLNEYKSYLVSNKISIISNIILALSLIFLTIFNGYWNAIIVFVIIFATLIDSLVLKPIFYKKERKINEEERKLEKVKNIEEFKKTYSKVKTLSNKYAYGFYFKKMSIIAIILFTIYGVVTLTGDGSLITILFYFMISLQLQNAIKDLFEIQNKRKLTNTYKVRLNNLHR